MKTFAEIPKTDAIKVRGWARDVMSLVVDCAVAGKRISQQAVDSVLWREAPKLFAKIKRHELYRAAASWMV